MNRHVKSYSEKLNESIGRGSVLLIKGKPMQDGRYLYVTTIDGFAEIKPGLKMVFLSDTIYRVIYKGENKFSGRKVDYRGEDGLKGIFNMRNPGRPSIVLNHNKTPFHWLTLKHTDIGKALRELGPRLFSHDLILESNENQLTPQQYIVHEMLKEITGRESNIIIKKVEISEDYDLSDFRSDAEQSENSTYEEQWEMFVYLTLKEDNLPPSVESEYSESIEGEMFSDMGVDVDEIIVSLSMNTTAELKHSYDPGDYYTPSYSETEIIDINTYIDINTGYDEVRKKNEIARKFYKDVVTPLLKKSPNGTSDEVKAAYAEYQRLVSEGPNKNFIMVNDVPAECGNIPFIKTDIDILERMANDYDPAEFVGRLNEIIGVNKSNVPSKELAKLEYEYHSTSKNITQSELEKWKDLHIEADTLKREIEELVKEQLDLESRDGELNDDEIQRSKEIIEEISSKLPTMFMKSEQVIVYPKRGFSNNQIHHIIKNIIDNTLMNMMQYSPNTERKAKQLEQKYQMVKYNIKKNKILGKSSLPRHIEKELKRVNFFLKPEDRL